MVNCYSCKKNLIGNWTLNYSGQDNGLKLGVDACFAYNGEGWIYCFCPNCYKNGKFPQEFKNWYAQPLKQILSQQLESRDQQIGKIKSLLQQRDVEIAQLKKTIKKMKFYERLISQKQVIKIKETDEYILRSKNLLLNHMDEQFKNYIELIKEKFLQIFQEVSKQRIQNLVTKLEEREREVVSDIEKIQNLVGQFKQIFKQTKTFKQQDLINENLIERTQQPLLQKKSLKTDQLNLLRDTIKEGKRFLEIN